MNGRRLGSAIGPVAPMMKDRRAIEVGVVNTHRRVQQADQIMHDSDHRLALDAGVAMGDLHGDFFMLAEQHGRIVLAVIDQRIVQPR